MKKLLLCSILIAFGIQLNAQIGVHFKVNSAGAAQWDKIVSLDLPVEEKTFASGIEYGLDWWLRLKKYRIEWTPEISYGKSENSFVSTTGNNRTYKMETFNFVANNNIYIFDLKEPDCPRYGLQGDVFKKGFFLQISPGLTKFQQEFSTEGNIYKSKTTAFKLGIGAGMDFVFWNLISVTPYAKINFYPRVSWENLRETHAGGSPQITTGDSPVKQIQLGVRIGLRPKILRE